MRRRHARIAFAQAADHPAAGDNRIYHVPERLRLFTALLVGQRFGLDANTMVDVLNESSGMNNSTKLKFKQHVLSRRFESGFSLDLMVKDIGIALEVARETQTPTPYAALCREVWAAAQAMLEPGQDHTGMAKLSEKLANEVLGGNK